MGGPATRHNDKTTAMDRDRNLLFGVFAVQLRKVTPSQIMEAASAWASDPSKALSDRLIELQALTESDREFLNGLVEQSVSAHGGDAAATLLSLGGPGQVARSFYGSVKITPSGALVAPEMDLSSSESQALGVEETPGRYSQVGETARGGMGRILLVHDEVLGRDVALKELLSGLAPSSDGSPPQRSPVREGMSLLSRFLQEARITGQLEHPSIVPVYELGHRSDGTIYYTMKLVRGETLEEAIASARDLNTRLGLLNHFIDLCQGIAYSHSMKVIHRDIKPSNVMVGKFGETVVLDWGLAKVKDKEDVHSEEIKETIRMMNLGDEEAVGKTAYGEVMGTPLYMPPEQAKGQLELVDERSDVYSLGAVLYELLTGTPPFEPGPLKRILEQVIGEEPKRIRDVIPDVPSELAAICEKSLSKDPMQRYSSAKALAEEVERFQSGALVQAYQYKARELVRRFVIRHRPLVTGAAIATMALIALSTYSYISILQARDDERLARVEAERARDRAEAERSEADLARGRAEQETQRAEENQYYASIQLASARLAQNQPELARSALLDTPNDRRHWEWGYLLGLASVSESDDSALSARQNEHAGNTVDLWRGAAQKNTITLQGHTGRIQRARFSQDGNRIATASDDKSVRIWNANDGTLVSELSLESPVFDASFSPDGRFLATGEFERRVILWNLESLEPINTFADYSNPVALVTFSPNGEFLVTATLDMKLRVWHLGTGLPVLTRQFREPILDTAFSVEGELLVPTAEAVYAYPLSFGDTGEDRIASDGHGTSSIIWASPLMIAGTDSDNLLTLWNSNENKTVFEAKLASPHGLASILPVAFSVDGTTCTAVGDDAEVRIVDTVSGDIVSRFPAVASAEAYHAQFSPDGERLALVHEGNLVRIYEPGTGSNANTGVLAGHTDLVFHLAFNADGSRLATASYDGNVIVWDMKTRTELFRLEGHTGELLTVVYTPEHNLIGTAAWDDQFRVWAADTGALIFQSELGLEGRPIGGGPRSPMVMVASGMTEMRRYNPDVSLIVAPGPGNGSVVFDTRQWEPKFVLEGHSNWTWQQEFSPNGKQIVSHAYQSKSPKVWDVETGKELFELSGHEADVHLVKFSHDSSKLVTASFDGSARVWDARTGAELQRLEGHNGGLASARFSPDDLFVVTGSIDQTARLWDADSGETVSEFRGHGHWVINADFSADGQRILTTSLDESVKIWDLKGRELVTLKTGSRIFYVAWSPDNRVIATALADGTTRLWDSEDWREE